jgi:uncharacterized membrane protein
MANDEHNRAPAPAGSQPALREGAAGDDRILPETRLVSIFIPPFLIVAFIMLYFFPHDGVSLNGAPLFAWVINPPMTPLIMAAGYISGAYFFVRLIIGGKWHWFAHGFPAITAFTTCMGLSTLLHWDRFLHNHVSFYAWLILYLVTPFLVPALWWRNRSADPGTPDPGDVVVPQAVRTVVAAISIVMVALALFMFIFPQVMIGIWPWTLTPLTARVVGGWFALPGVMGLFVSRDSRWSSWRILLESQMIAFVLIIIAVVRAWADFNPANPMTWVFIASLLILLAGIVAFYTSSEASGRRRATARA